MGRTFKTQYSNDNCQICSHKEYCKWTKQFTQIQEKIFNDKILELDTTPFSIICKCKYYQTNNTTRTEGYLNK